MTCRTQINQAARNAMQTEQKAEENKIEKLHGREEQPQEPGDSHVPKDQSYPRGF